MADESEFLAIEVDKFHQCSRKISRMVFRDAEELRTELNNRLDELNSIEYSIKFVKDDEASSLLCQLCVLVPVKYEMLVTKVCQLVVNIVNRQQVNLDHRGLDITTEYLLEALKTSQPWSKAEILRALGAVVYENVGRLERFQKILLGEDGMLLQLTEEKDEDTQRCALQCVENLCLRTPNCPYLSEDYITRCYHLFMRILQTPRPDRMDEVTHGRLLVSAIRGIQNILLTTKSFPGKSLGELLAAIKVYMLHGLPGQPAAVPTCMYPTPLSQYDPSPAPPPPKPDVKTETEEISLRPDSTKSTKTPAKRAKKKKSAKAKTKEDGTAGSDDKSNNASAELEKLRINDADQMSSSSAGQSASVFSPYPAWSRISSSESEYSDTEGGQSSKLRSYNCRVRQCALGTFHATIKAVDRRVMFGFWTCFIPDTASTSSTPQTQTLFTSILRDPSPKVRTAALAVLTALLEGSKQYLAAADDSDQYRTFTSFSVTLGSMIKELHRCLSQVLSAENSPLAVTQVIKCLATLVLNVPYQKLRPGLLTKVVKQVKPFLSHRDPNVRVACLTCLGSVVISQAPLLEVCHILHSSRLQLQKLSESSRATPGGATRPSLAHETAAGDTLQANLVTVTGVNGGQRNEQREAQSVSQSTDSVISEDNSIADSQISGDQMLGASSVQSGVSSSTVDSGTVTPTHTPDHAPDVTDIPWMVRLSVSNVASHLLDQADAGRTAFSHVEPLPVRLESLQLLASLAKGYFVGIRKCLPLIRDVIHSCLQDKDPSVQLHAAKLLEEAGRMLMFQLQEANAAQSQSLNVTEVVEFWTKLLQGPVAAVLQTDSNHAVRATTCDAVANIGHQAFENLPMDRRLVCITLLLGLTSDEDRHVRAAAVRALGLYVLYPCLREDVSFVADAGNAILASLAEPTLSVRIKAAWSLGNLGDALVMNKDNGDEAFMDDLSDMLLMKLFSMATKASMDNDKVRSNAVRALGNLLRYISDKSLKKSSFVSAVDQAVEAVVKNIGTGTMKVRWNACYAANNLFKNPLLPLGQAVWTEQLLGTLAAAVRDCKNFKVRINASIALSIPPERQCFGNEQTFSKIWENLIAGLEGSEVVTDFTEYKYRDNMREQVCSTIVTLAMKIRAEDLMMLGEVLEDHGNSLSTYMESFRQRTKDDNFEKACNHLNDLNKATLTSVQSKVMTLLTSVFQYRISDRGLAKASSPKTAFVQSFQ